jgi:phosphohistidine phosphatase
MKMGKELFFIRHSEAREAYRGQPDIERELTESGSIRAMQLANYLKSKGVQPDALLSSEAVRARTTAELLGEKLLQPGQEIVYHQDLYESSMRLMLAAINTLDNNWKTVILVGHNPVLPYTVEYLTGTILETLEPGGFLRLHTEANDWAEISGKTMDVQEYISPSAYAQV